MLRTLSDTSIYKYADSIRGEGLSDKIKFIASEHSGTIYLTDEMLDDVFYKIRHKSFNFSAKFAVIELYKKGIIQLIYNEKNRLPVAVPFFRKKMPAGGYGVVVNISNFATMQSDATIVINPLTLYVLMLSAAFSLILESNIGQLMNGLPDLYGGLFANVVARMSNLDQIKRAKIQFIATKFFYIQLGMDEVKSTTAAAKKIKYLDDMLLHQTDMAFPVNSYDNLENLCDGIKRVFPEFKGFELGTFFDRWLRSYGEISAFAIEYIPFFCTMLVALVCNANNLVTIVAMEREADKNNKDIINLFNRMENAVINLAKR